MKICPFCKKIPKNEFSSSQNFGPAITPKLDYFFRSILINFGDINLVLVNIRQFRTNSRKVSRIAFPRMAHNHHSAELLHFNQPSTSFYNHICVDLVPSTAILCFPPTNLISHPLQLVIAHFKIVSLCSCTESTGDLCFCELLGNFCPFSETIVSHFPLLIHPFSSEHDSFHSIHFIHCTFVYSVLDFGSTSFFG